MLVTTEVIPPPSRSVKEDLFTRSGPANEFSYTPYDGMQDMVRSQFKNVSDLSIDDLINSISDLRLDKLKPHLGDDPNDDERSMSDDYDVFFENIGQEWIDKYATMMLVGYKLNRKNSYREYAKDNLEVVKMFADDETGEYVSESDLLSKRNVVTSEYIKAKNRIPHLLKMLFKGSKLYGVHLLSCLIAYNKAKDQSPIGDVTSRAFRRAGIYRVDSKGKITRLIRDDEDSSAKYQTIWHWINNEIKDDIYYKAAIDLMSCLLCCNVDITLEDPLRYDLEFFQKLNVFYVPNNDEFINYYASSLGTKFTNLIKRDGIAHIMNSCVESSDDETDSLDSVSPAALPQKLIDLIADNTSCMSMMYPDEWNMTDETLRSIDEFLINYIPYISKYLKRDFERYRLLNFSFRKDYMVSRRSGLYFCICINPLLKHATSELKLGCISMSGKLVLVSNASNKISYINCSDVSSYVRTGDETYKAWCDVYI